MSATATIPDLWPTDFNIGSEPSPSTILRQQGYILGERTGDVVYGEVESKIDEPGRFLHTLYLSSPFVKLRQYALFVRHGFDPYPAEITLLAATGSHLRHVTVGSYEEFVSTMRDMLASPHIVQLVGSLVSQAREQDDE